MTDDLQLVLAGADTKLGSTEQTGTKVILHGLYDEPRSCISELQAANGEFYD